MWLFTSSQTFLLLRKPHIHLHTNRQRRYRQIDVSNFFSLDWFQLSAVSEWIDHKWGMPRKHTQLSLKCNGISRMFEMCPLILPSGLILTALNPLLTIKYALNIREAAPVQHHNLSDTVWLSIWHFHRMLSLIWIYLSTWCPILSVVVFYFPNPTPARNLSWEILQWENGALFLFLFFVPKRLLLDNMSWNNGKCVGHLICLPVTPICSSNSVSSEAILFTDNDQIWMPKTVPADEVLNSFVT